MKPGPLDSMPLLAPLPPLPVPATTLRYKTWPAGVRPFSLPHVTTNAYPLYFPQSQGLTRSLLPPSPLPAPAAPPIPPRVRAFPSCSSLSFLGLSPRVQLLSPPRLSPHPSVFPALL
ncbi:hypothetical protein B0H12DRAFT_1231881 [Mycena haematopus]|nr:hypothetical protein B0H12DRAFT_1231881 [Mycena haematopus]